jgi:2-polyprenyl-6-methoxyphenol hydroxylase-like FAD-dependent oxidoreductase
MLVGVATHWGWPLTGEPRYGAPHLVLHRGDLLALLVREARLHGVNIVTDCTAARIDFSACTVCTVSGRVFTGDVLIGADGIKSAARDACLGKDTSPQPTGRLVYRHSIPTHKITANPNIRALVEPEKDHLLDGARCACCMLQPHRQGYLQRGAHQIGSQPHPSINV